MAADQDHDYDTLTRSTTDSGNYANLSDAYAEKDRKYLDDSFSESFEDPSAWLDKHPPTVLDTNDTISRRPPMPLPKSGEHTRHENVEEGVQSIQPPHQPPTGLLQPDQILPFSDSDEEEDDIDEDSQLVSETLGRQRTESDVIDIIGSLCLEGVFQGMTEEDQANKSMVPESIRMTQNLVKHGAELDELSVMVTRNLEIVPESPFDANTGTRKAKGIFKSKVSRQSVPQLRLRAKTEVPERPHSSVPMSKVDHRPTSVTYFDYIVRPPPLPPLDDSLPNNEVKRYRVMESLLESEAAFLTSLNIAIEVYKKPLLVKLKEANPVLERDQIQNLFGPIRHIQTHHELFYAAISEETKDWSPSKQIGGVFLASFSPKDVVKHYCQYVNNFSNAMNILGTNIKKKQRFLDFLKRQIVQSSTNLSLQALLLKPIQRFPQYLLFLQDLIKFTPATHEDSIKLQMAQAQIERIADYLNEAKRSSEQLMIVQYLSSKIHRLNFRLTDLNRYLLRQDSIQWVTVKSNGEKVIKRRELLMFDRTLICCASKRRKRKSKSVTELIPGGDQMGDDEILVFKWACPITQLEVTEPDYINKEGKYHLITAESEESPELQTTFQELQTEFYQLNFDFEKLCKIETIISTLYGRYQVISSQGVRDSIRIVQRNLERVRDLLRNCEPCRVDITIPGRDPGSKVRFHHILVFPSDVIKRDWLRTLHFATLRLSHSNNQRWIMEEEEEESFIEWEEDETEEQQEGEGVESGGGAGGDYSMPCSVDSLPLVVDQIKLMGYKDECTTVECAACVGSNRVWLSCSGLNTAHIAIIRCFTPTPMLLETFTIDCNRILCMKAIPTTRSHVETSVSSSPSNSLNVWVGTSCGKLMLFDAVTRMCVTTQQLTDSVLCIESYKNRAFVGLANGKVNVYTRARGGLWDLTSNIHHIPVAESSIQCFCSVDTCLWIGVTNVCVVLNMETLKLEHSIKLTSEQGVSVKRLAASSNGVWLALSKGSNLYLYHKDTRKPIQEIDIRGSLINIMSCANIKEKFTSLSNLRISSLLLSSGYLWVGTSEGAVLVYRIPYLHGLPVTNGKPFLASDGHTDAVRVIVEIHTTLDLPSARFDQFVSDEKERKIGSFYSPPRNIRQGRAMVDHMTTEDVKTSEESDTSEEEEKSGLAVSMKIDQSALPIVSDIIKRLENPKTFFPRLSPGLNRRSKNLSTPKVKPKPKTKRKPNQGKTTTAMASSAPSDGKPNTHEQNKIGIMKSAGDTKSIPTIQVDQTSIEQALPHDMQPEDYETPVKRDEHFYDQVPIEELDDGEELEATSSGSDINIHRYEGNSIPSLGDGLYDNLRSSTISITIPGRNGKAKESTSEDGAVFVLTGGRGLISYRSSMSRKESGSQILNPQNVDIAASVIAYQLP